MTGAAQRGEDVARPFVVATVEPIGDRVGVAFVCLAAGTGGFRNMVSNVYPESPRGEALRVARLAAGQTLGSAARALGMSPVDLSGLEMGRRTLDDAGEWDRATAIILPAEQAERAGTREREASDEVEAAGKGGLN